MSIYDAQGTQLRKFGSHGSTDGCFASPVGVCADEHNNIYVADFSYVHVYLPFCFTLLTCSKSNQRIQKFDEEGHFITKWGSPGTGNGELSNPWGITVDPQGNVVVCDASYVHIPIFVLALMVP